MNQTQYAKVGRFSVGAVDFVSKAKSCGKENCERCPHAGYWYAYVPEWACSKHKRVEVYCGRKWDSEFLRSTISPLLLPAWRQEFLRIVTREDAVLRLRDIAESLQRNARAAKEEKGGFVRRMAVLRSDAARLRVEAAALRRTAAGKGRAG